MDSITTDLRADAQRNRDSLVVAARTVFAREGLDAPLDVVAQEARVGRATLYRRFPTREDLIHAIFADAIDRLEDIAAESAHEDYALFKVLVACARMQQDDRGFLELLARDAQSDATNRQVEERVCALIAGPLHRAQAAGIVRDDLRADDVLTVMRMAGTAVRNSASPHPPDRAARAFALLCNALLTPEGPDVARGARGSWDLDTDLGA